MQTLSTILLLICFLWLCKVKKKEELQNCAWNSEFALCRECNLTLFCLTAIYWETCLFICGFLIFRSPSLALALSVRVEWNRMAACMQGWVSSVQKIFYIQLLRLFPCFVLFFGLFVFSKVDNSSESDDMSYYYEYQNYDYLLLMLLLLIIIKCWMLSFMVCSFFFGYFISCIRKKKLLYFALLWTASHGAFINLLLCQFMLSLSYLLLFLFLLFFFFYQGGKHIHCQTSLLDIDWNMYSAHAFASLMYTNWLISNQKQSSNLYT